MKTQQQDKDGPGAHAASDAAGTKEVESKIISESSESPSSTAELSEKTWVVQRALQGAGGILLFLLAVIVVVSVLMRVIGQGLIGVVELGAISMVVITVLVIPSVTAADENFRVEVIDFFVSQETIRRLDVMGLFLQTIVGVVLTVSAIDLFINDVVTGTTLTGELGVPRMWITLLVSLGFLAMVHALGVRLVREVRGQDRPSSLVRQEEQRQEEQEA